jgi:tRNA U38,U39,U40 pseudouridine synthase TruA
MAPHRNRVEFYWIVFNVELLMLGILVHPFSRVLFISRGVGVQQRLSLFLEALKHQNEDITVSRSVLHQCKLCNQTGFASRNDLFRHIRSVHEDSNSNDNATALQLQSMPTQLALLVAYYNTESKDNYLIMDHTLIDRGNLNSTLSSIAGDQIRDACLWTLNDTQKASTMDLVGMTQSSVARQRHISLSQDANCAAAGDVIILNFRIYGNDYIQPSFINTMNTFIQQNQRESHMLHIVSAVKIPSINLASLHAEQSCTQLIYHYLLPLSWILIGPKSFDTIEEIRSWWINMKGGGEEAIFARSHPPSAVLRLKRVLQCIRSNHVTDTSQKDYQEDPHRKKRFGSLARFERKAFHNFADPTLKGKASPNHDPVWRALDQVKLVDFIASQYSHDLVAVIEFRGDGFVKEQIRRLVGSLVAVFNGWLPDNFFDLATRPDVVLLETPLAPDNHSYLAAARFHYYELVNNHGLFSCKRHQPQPHFLFPSSHTTTTGSRKSYHENRDVERDQMQKKWIRHVQQALLQLSDLYKEKCWINNLRDTIAPRIVASLKNVYFSHLDHNTSCQKGDSASTKSLSYKGNHDAAANSDVPSVYHNTLMLLRSIHSTKKWPTTSNARSRVIAASSFDSASSGAKQGGDIGGSFTVVNSKLAKENSKINSIALPHSNFLFPELVEAVFELEKMLNDLSGAAEIQSSSRPPSTHCAINCNAQFLPHVDSGRGKGQSLSMIVGLGEYSGGELIIEGVPYDIKFKPMEFDGWKLRHWTAPFEGERYSLVWFTPELS